MLRSFASQVPRVSSVAASSTTAAGNQCLRNLSTANQKYAQCQQQQQRPLNRRLEVDLHELTMMQCLEDLTLIDVRQPAELQFQEQIPGSVHIPLGNLRDAFQLSEADWQQKFNTAKPNKINKGIIFYARGPIASSAAVEIAHKLGYKKSRHYVGGWEDYCIQNNIPFLKVNGDSTAPGLSSEDDDSTIKQHYNYHYYNPDLHYL
uniref:Thiosulfate sulfurtransferase/rhodanese-like domain-containing protein 3 n=1 Tax=Hirondellea gigas TaxID=1518452 RepID=A0A2P2HVJ2_9CRUS